MVMHNDRKSMRTAPPTLARLGLAVVMMSSLGLLPACSLSKVQPQVCQDNSECRDAFGRGWTCEESGLCAEAPALNRCSSHPPGILEDLASYEDWILLGSVFDQADFEIMVKAARLSVINVNRTS